MTATHRTANVAKPEKRAFNQTCSRCGGDGVWKGWYKGTCYRCGGNGVDPTPSREWVFPTEWTAEQVAAFYAKKEEARCKRAAKKTDARQARMQAACDAHPSVAALRASWLADDETPEAALWYTVSNVAQDIMWKAFDYTLTEKQVAYLDAEVAKATERIAAKAEQAAKRAEEKANAQPVPTGRVTITGTVVSRKWYDGDFGSTCKLLIVGAEGWKVFVTEPKSLTCAVGDVVELKCSITAAADDVTFGKGKNPSAGRVVEAAQS